MLDSQNISIKEYFENFKHFETQKLPNWYVSENVNTIYFPNGNSDFMMDISEIFMKYLESKISIEQLLA